MRSNPDPSYSFPYLADDDLHQLVARLGAWHDGASGFCLPGDPEPAPPRHPFLVRRGRRSETVE